MPVRILRPTLRTSERWNRCSFFEQSFYIRLITIADDYGRYEAHPALLASECFPYGDADGLPVIAMKVDGMLRSLASKDLLFVYEIEGKQYFQLTRWKERVRLEKGSHYPDPAKGKIVWKCQSDDWQMSDRCQSDVGNPEIKEVTDNTEVTKNSGICQSDDRQMPASPPTPTPTPTYTPTPSAVAGKCVRALKKEFQDNGRFQWLSETLCRFYKRPRLQVAIGEEEYLVAEISSRPEVEEEWIEISNYRQEVGEKYFPQSLKKLCQDWDDTLDKARNHAPAPKSSKEMSITERAITNLARAEGIL